MDRTPWATSLARQFVSLPWIRAAPAGKTIKGLRYRRDRVRAALQEAMDGPSAAEGSCSHVSEEGDPDVREVFEHPWRIL